jgi:predicted NAD/FAD-dependent oxidoreductase
MIAAQIVQIRNSCAANASGRMLSHYQDYEIAAQIMQICAATWQLHQGQDLTWRPAHLARYTRPNDPAHKKERQHTT